MSGVLKNLEPRAVFEYFERLSQIPRGSGNEKAVSDYLVSFAKEHKLEVSRDRVMNVIIKKPATPGYEKAPTVILQGHMDMVCEKNKDTIHDFEKDPIKLRIVNDMIYATDTTLGADNGIALAMALAILEAKDIPHPALEALFTVEEESAMGGAFNLDASPLNGKLLINLDSEEEGYLLVSSAGGVKAKLSLPVEWETADSRAVDSKVAYRISITGLKGGHSGAEIDKGRGNANVLMGRLLNALLHDFDFRLKSLSGGLMSNAITREAEAVVFMDSTSAPKLEAVLAGWQETFRNELRTADPNVSVKLEALKAIEPRVFSKASTGKAVAALVTLPCGVQSMSMEINGLVESSCNVGYVQTTAEAVDIIDDIRSSVKSLKEKIFRQAEAVGELLGCEVLRDCDYPEWAYKPDSKLRTLFQKVYKEKYSKEPHIIALHAGLECGVFNEKIKGLDCISLGPNLYDVHTPNEHMSISSTKNIWEYLLEVLKQMNTL